MNILKLPTFFLAFLATFAGCEQPLRISTPKRSPDALSGSAYYKKVGDMKWNEREPIALKEILGGDIPQFLKTFVPIRVSIIDSTGHTIHCTYFVAPDYLSIGSDRDFARVPLTPMAAQQIADSFHCFLPTRKMVNDIYAQAKVKLEPVPLYAFRDSALIFWHHHLIIEGQRKGRKGLIAGIKKILSSAKN